MGIRRSLLSIIGIIQGTIGLLAGISTLFLYFNLFDVQTRLNVHADLLFPYVFILSTFSFFSILNGLFLIYE